MFVNDKDSGATDNESVFSNIRLLNSSGVNEAPVLQNPGNQTTAQGSDVSIQLQVYDPEGDAVTLTATGLPTGVELLSQQLTGAPDSAGQYQVALTA